jgi:hypothetical protein
MQGRGRSEERVIEIQSRMEVRVEKHVVTKCEAQAVLRLEVRPKRSPATVRLRQQSECKIITPPMA